MQAALSVSSAVPAIERSVLMSSIQLIASLDNQITAAQRREALFEYFSGVVVGQLDELVTAVDARMEAYCRISQSNVYRAWMASKSHVPRMDICRIAACAPVTLNEANEFVFDQEIFFAMLMARTPVAGRT